MWLDRGAQRSRISKDINCREARLHSDTLLDKAAAEENKAAAIGA